jgi:hypothetical protein
MSVGLFQRAWIADADPQLIKTRSIMDPQATKPRCDSRPLFYSMKPLVNSVTVSASADLAHHYPLSGTSWVKDCTSQQLPESTAKESNQKPFKTLN